MSRKPCLFFAQGRCARGSSCAFDHSSIPQTVAAPLSSAPKYLQASSAPQFGPASLKIPCKFYQRGACQNLACRFLHVDIAASPVAQRGLKEAAVKVPNAPTLTSLSEAPICPFFSRGSCKFGDQCRYFHDKQTTEAQQKSQLPMPTSSSVERLSMEALSLSEQPRTPVRGVSCFLFLAD